MGWKLVAKPVNTHWSVLYLIAPSYLLLSKVQDLKALKFIAEDLQQEPLSGVSGLVTEVEPFVQTWQTLTGQSYRREIEMRLYQLTQVLPMATVNGYLRLATQSDRPLLLQWFTAFNSEIEIVTDDVIDAIQRMVDVELKRQSIYRTHLTSHRSGIKVLKAV